MNSQDKFVYKIVHFFIVHFRTQNIRLKIENAIILLFKNEWVRSWGLEIKVY